MFDVEKIRKDFPTISPESVYFDSVASSLTPNAVIDTVVEYYTKYRANVHRGSYDLSMKASEKFEEAVSTVADFIGAKPSEIVITSNATHSINEVALTLDFNPGDEVLSSVLEHSSNMVPWGRLETKVGIKTRWYNPGKLGLFDINEFEKMISDKTKLVTLTYVSNAIGTVVPVKEVGRICRQRGIPFLVDAAQAAPHMKIDVKDIGCDFLAFSGHKMLGPTGVGVLYIREELADLLVPGILGGGTIDTGKCNCNLESECNLNNCSFSELPYKWQAGTPPIADALGLKTAIDYLSDVGFANIQQHEDQLMRQLIEGLSSVNKIDIFGPKDPELRKSIVSFNIGEIPADEVGRILNENYNIAVRTGQHCAVGYFKDESIDTKGNVRASVYLYNTKEEVDRFLNAINDIAKTCLY
ncbi:MAG: cysteine desulfurase [Oscillospiraceae bacterium]|nr:cysteine desulfurase [Oscillospiraceae bacterium]